MIWRSERRTPGAIAEGLGFGRRFVRRPAHPQDDGDDVSEIVGVKRGGFGQRLRGENVIPGARAVGRSGSLLGVNFGLLLAENGHFSMLKMAISGAKRTAALPSKS